jgi:hypothetical protein
MCRFPGNAGSVHRYVSIDKPVRSARHWSVAWRRLAPTDGAEVRSDWSGCRVVVAEYPPRIGEDLLIQRLTYPPRGPCRRRQGRAG